MTEMKTFSTLSSTMLLSLIIMMLSSTVLAKKEKKAQKECKVWFSFRTNTTDIDRKSPKNLETIDLFGKAAELEAQHFQEHFIRQLRGSIGVRELSCSGSCTKCINFGTGFWTDWNCEQYCSLCWNRRDLQTGGDVFTSSIGEFTSSTGEHITVIFENGNGTNPIGASCTEMPEEEVQAIAKEKAVEKGVKFSTEIGGPIKSNLKVYLCCPE